MLSIKNFKTGLYTYLPRIESNEELEGRKNIFKQTSLSLQILSIVGPILIGCYKGLKYFKFSNKIAKTISSALFTVSFLYATRQLIVLIVFREEYFNLKKTLQEWQGNDENKQAVSHKILKCFAIRYKTLDISGHKLNEIPPILSFFPWVYSLNISGNLLQTFPQEVFQLKSLEILRASNNQLSDLPPEFSQLNILKHLYLEENLFSHIPYCIRSLRDLKTCSFVKCQNLKTVPLWFADRDSPSVIWQFGIGPTGEPRPIEYLGKGRFNEILGTMFELKQYFYITNPAKRLLLHLDLWFFICDSKDFRFEESIWKERISKLTQANLCKLVTLLEDLEKKGDIETNRHEKARKVCGYLMRTFEYEDNLNVKIAKDFPQRVEDMNFDAVFEYGSNLKNANSVKPTV